jgi:hypothetical protein
MGINTIINTMINSIFGSSLPLLSRMGPSTQAGGVGGAGGATINPGVETAVKGA